MIIYGKEVITGELTVPWEDNIDEGHERKLTKYTELAAECRDRCWKALCYPFEVGCRGFIANSFHKCHEILASTGEGSSLLVEQPQKQHKQDHHGYGPSI